jgi:uncharacterized protein (DUF885 family)
MATAVAATAPTRRHRPLPLRILKWLLVGLLALVLLVGGFVWWQWTTDKPLKITWLYERVFMEYVLDDPEMLSAMRVLPSWLDFHSDKLTDASLERDARMVEKLKRDYASLKSYDRAELEGQDRLSYDILDYFLGRQVADERWQYHNFPVNQMFGVQSSLPNFMVQMHPVRSADDARSYIARLEQFPVKFDQVVEGLRHRESLGVFPQRFVIDKVLEQMRGFVADPPEQHLLYVSLAEKLDGLDEAIDADERTELLARARAAVADKVYPAYAGLIGHFEQLQAKVVGNHGAWSLPDGDAFYADRIRAHTTTEMDAEQIHAIGLAEVARIGAEMDAILRAQGLEEGSIGARVQQINRRPDQLFPDTDEGRAQILAEFQRIIDEISAGLGPYFDVMPKAGVEVRRVPAFSEKTAPGAYYQGPAMDGSRPGVFYANLRNVAEMPRFTMRTLAYHEGVPGHHFQIAIMQELKGVPQFRRVLPFTAYSEGWALYTEQLAWEAGFQDDPLDNLGRLRDEMFRAVRLVVDTGMHAKRWSREQAIEYMLENTGMTETDVVAEIERYLVNPGQALAYKVGMLKILELRERARAELGERFDIRAFHNQVLTNGAMPLAILEQVIDAWIAQTRAAAPAAA